MVDEAKGDEYLWLEFPSELGIAAIEYLQTRRVTYEKCHVLDIGCGNGRDAFYFAKKLNCTVLGIDISQEAVDIAQKAAREKDVEDVKFQCRSYTDLKVGKYDVLLCASVYHFLNQETRQEFREVVKRSLKPDGFMFLSTLSVSDQEYYGKGTPVSDEPNSFRDEIYVHFSTKQELAKDFAFLDIKELYEHDDYDPRIKGPVNYIPWILVGEYARAGSSV